MRRVFITINMSAPGWKSWGIRGSQGSGFITCIPGAICITQLLHPHPLSRWTPEQFRDQKHCPTWLMTNWALSSAIVSGRNYSASQPASLQVAMQRIWLNHKSNRAFPVHFVSEPDFGFELRLAGCSFHWKYGFIHWKWLPQTGQGMRGSSGKASWWRHFSDKMFFILSTL